MTDAVELAALVETGPGDEALGITAAAGRFPEGDLLAIVAHRAGGAQRWDPAEVLRVLISEEIKGRDADTKRMRRKAAGLPAGKTFDSWRQ
jgi:hypothetical protein